MISWSLHQFRHGSDNWNFAWREYIKCNNQFMDSHVLNWPTTIMVYDSTLCRVKKKKFKQKRIVIVWFLPLSCMHFNRAKSIHFLYVPTRIRYYKIVTVQRESENNLFLDCLKSRLKDDTLSFKSYYFTACNYNTIYVVCICYTYCIILQMTNERREKKNKPIIYMIPNVYLLVWPYLLYANQTKSQFF